MKPQPSALRSFFLLAYALTWGLLGPWFYAFNAAYHGDVPGWLWGLAPLAFVGGWGPSVAALIVTARAGGRLAVRRLAASLAAWRVPVRWYVAAFVVPPLLTAASVLIVDRGTATLRQFDPGAALSNLPVAYALALPFGPLGEELGWRGFALPRLLPKAGPVKASLLLGAIWTFWHVPMMLWSPGASIPSYMGLSFASAAIYLVQLTALTVLMTALFLGTRGSVLLAVIAHLAFNTGEAVLFGGLPHPPSAARLREVYLVNVALLAILAAFVVGWLAVRPARRAASGG